MINNQSLSPQVFYILLSLSVKERHGYEIMKQVEEASNGKIKLGPGTLYGAIKRLLKMGLILEVKNKTGARRRYYTLSEKGKKVLVVKLEEYSEALKAAKEMNIFSLLGGLKLSI